MPERHDLLDLAIQQMLDGATEVAIPRDLEPFAAVAADLLGLPDPEFKRRLGGRMTTTTDAQVLNVNPYLVAEDVNGLVDFVKRVFGAEETFRTGTPTGTHVEVRLAGTRLMIGGGTPGRSQRGAIHVLVPDVDAVHRRALEAGATSLYEPTDQAYGARDSAVRDAYGNEWYIATLQKAEGVPDMMAYFHPAGAPRMIEFLESALGAEVLERHESEGAIVHAKVRLGAAVVELGEAHGQWQPIPMMMFVNVDDADAAYARAVAAGAKPLSEPKDVPYGRSGAVEDPFGNSWYLTAENSSS
jgi:PhnB protein